jgi:uncharacterized protein (DUF1684 family)
MRRSVSLAAGVLLAASYESEILSWRAEREQRLKSDNGWLTVAGLYWLKEGRNSFGAAKTNDIVLPDGPAQAGWFELHDGKVSVHVSGEAARTLEPDREAAGSVVRIEGLTMFPIKRGSRYGIRLRDKNSSFRRDFRGLHWYPIKEAARITARFVAEPAKMSVPNILGETEQATSPGYVLFHWEGREFRLRATAEDGRLFFVFRDFTSGKETYPAGRFLYAEMPQNGHVVLDFNKAYNPPCAFTPYATCPLPTPENRMPVRIEAGELNYGSH